MANNQNWWHDIIGREAERLRERQRADLSASEENLNTRAQRRADAERLSRNLANSSSVPRNNWRLTSSKIAPRGKIGSARERFNYLSHNDEYRDIFDVASWYDSGASFQEFLSAAGAEPIARAIRNGGTQNILQALESGTIGPKRRANLDKLLDFYGRQYFAHRAEGSDTQEDFKSIIGRTEVGQFIEEVLNIKTNQAHDRLTRYSDQANDIRQSILRLKRYQRDGLITYNQYSDLVGDKKITSRRTSKGLWSILNDIRTDQRRAASEYFSLSRMSNFPAGEQSITRYIPELDTNLTDWTKLISDRLSLSKNQTELLHYLYYNPIKDPDEFRKTLGLINPRLEAIIPLGKDASKLIQAQTTINQTYNYLNLRAAGAFGSAKDVAFRNGGMFGMEGQILGLIDMNKWERGSGGIAHRLVNPPIGGNARPGLLVTPSNLTAKTMLGQIGMRPGITPEPKSSDLLRAFLRSPDRAWQTDDDMSAASDKVYGDISRQIRELVEKARFNLGPVTSTPITKDMGETYAAILGKTERLSSQRIAEELLAYYHVKPNITGDIKKDPLNQALYTTFTKAAEGDRFAQRIKDILTDVAPDIGNIGTYVKNGRGMVPKGYKDAYFDALEKAFRTSGIATRKGLGPAFTNAYTQFILPQRNNERVQMNASAAEVAIGGKLPETGLLGARPNDIGEGGELGVNLMSDEIEAAQLSLKLHDLDMQTRMFTGDRLHQAQMDMAKLLQEINNLGKEKAQRVWHYRNASTPLRAAEYRRAGIDLNLLPRPQAPKGATSIYASPAYRNEYLRLLRDLNSDIELSEGWRLNYLTSHYGKSIEELSKEQYFNQRSRNDNLFDFLDRLKGRGLNTETKRGLEFGKAYRQVGREIGKIYGMPMMPELINSAIEGNLTPFFGKTAHDVTSNMRQYIGKNFATLDESHQEFYRLLGGTDSLQFRLNNIETTLDAPDELVAKNKNTQIIHDMTAHWTLPEELSQEEKMRSVAAVHMEKWMEEWAQNPAMSYLTRPTEEGALSQAAIGQAMTQAGQLLSNANYQFGWREQYVPQSIGEIGNPEYDEDALFERFYSTLKGSVGSREVNRQGDYRYANVLSGKEAELEDVSENTFIDEAERLVELVRNFGNTRNPGVIMVPVSNAENLARMVPLDKLATPIGPRNTVAKDRMARNETVLHHYLNWNKIPHGNLNYGQIRGSFLTDERYYPILNGVRLQRSFFQEAMNEIESDLQKQNISMQMLKDISATIGNKGIYLSSKNPYISATDRIAALQALGKEEGSNLYAPLALGNEVNIGADMTKTLSEVWGHYVFGKSLSRQDLIGIADDLNLDVGQRDVGRGVSKSEILRALSQRAGFDLSPETSRRHLVDYFTSQINALKTPEVQGVLSEEQQNRIAEIFDQYHNPDRPQSQQRKSARELGIEEENRLRANRVKTDYYKRIGRSELKDLWSKRNVKAGIGAAGIFGLWGMIRAHNQKERNLASMQGPQNLPGGNTPYTNELPPPNVTAIPAAEFAEPNPNGNGYIYRIRASGNINPDQFQTQVMNITGAPIKSGSMYDNRPMPNPYGDMDDTLNNY